MMFTNLGKWALGAALALLASAAGAANLPLITGAQDPANEIQLLNQTLLSVNAGVDGNLAAVVAPAVTTLTTIQNLLTYTAPGALLSAAGQGIHIKAWGSNSADANVKTLTFAYGGISCPMVVTGSGTTWRVDFYLTKTGANSQAYECDGIASTGVIGAVVGTGAVLDTAPVTIAIQGTAATAGTLTLAGGYVEQLK